MALYMLITLFLMFFLMFFSPLGVVRVALAGIFCILASASAALVRDKIVAHKKTGVEMDAASIVMSIIAIILLAAFLPKFTLGEINTLSYMGIGVLVSYIWHAPKKAQFIKTTVTKPEGE